MRSGSVVWRGIRSGCACFASVWNVLRKLFTSYPVMRWREDSTEPQEKFLGNYLWVISVITGDHVNCVCRRRVGEPRPARTKRARRLGLLLYCYSCCRSCATAAC